VRRSPARLVIALSVAAVLAVFILYTSIAGAGTPQIQPSDLPQHHGTVLLVGKVVGAPAGDSHSAPGLRFSLRNVNGDTSARVPVRYSGEVPNMFKTGREVVVEGSLREGTFVAKPNSLSTKCPSKYAPAKKNSST
jgi:cytochrome c-type biogenesis protein CcmE